VVRGERKSMKKLTALDLQTTLDECAEKRYKSHSDWLSGMVNRLNAVISDKPIRIQTGNTVEPTVPCIS